MKCDQWICHDPVFECEQYNPEMLTYSPWAGHRNFAYDYVAFARPSVIVELGSYYGCSAFAFLQAIKDHGLDTSFFAVDTWQGDDFTKNDYTEDIYNAYRQINEQCFSGVRSSMLRMTFDEACGKFADKSIDLLHIDGSHKYEDVRNDYLRWRGKVADDGVIFFHDVGADLLFGEPMGSYIFWNELKREHPFTVEFPFSNGLGILFYSEDQYRQFQEAVPMGAYQQRINLQDTINKDLIRKNSFAMRDLRLYNADLQEQVRIMDEHLARYREDTAAASGYIGTLEARCEEYEKAAAQKAADICCLEQQCRARETALEEQRGIISRLEEQMAQLNAFAADKDCYAKELEAQRDQLRDFAADKDRYAKDLETQMEQLHSFAADKDRYAKDLESQMEQLRGFAADKEHYTEELLAQIKELNRYADGKTEAIVRLEADLESLNRFVQQKEAYITELQGQVSDLNAYAAGKCGYIEQLAREKTAVQQENEDLQQQLARKEAALEAMTQKYDTQKETMEALCGRVSKLPFGRRLVEQITASREEE